MSGRNVTSSLLVLSPRASLEHILASAPHQLDAATGEDASAAEEEGTGCWEVLEASKAVYLYIFPVLLLVGVLLNGVNFVLFRSSLGLRLYSFTVFVCTLGVTDSLALVAQAPRRWLSLLYAALHHRHNLLLLPLPQPPSSPNPASPSSFHSSSSLYETSDVVCKALTYAAELAQFVSLWTVVLVAWERSIVAQNPYRQSRFRQRRTALHAVALLVVAGLVLNSHVILSWQTTTTTQPTDVAMTTPTNATTSLMTSQEDAGAAATTGRRNRPVAAGHGRCASDGNGENRMRNRECVGENRERGGNGRDRGLEEIERRSDQMTKKENEDRQDARTVLRADDRNIDNYTTQSIPLFSPTHSHHERRDESRVEGNNGSRTTALNQTHRSDTSPDNRRHSSSSNHDKDPFSSSSQVLHRTTVSSGPSGEATTTPSEASTDGKMDNKMERSDLESRLSVELTMNATDQNGTTDTESPDWNPLQQVANAMSLLSIQDGVVAPEGSSGSRPLMGRRMDPADDDSGMNASHDSIEVWSPELTGDNGNNQIEKLGNFSSYSANNETSVEGRPEQTGSEELRHIRNDGTSAESSSSSRRRLKRSNMRRRRRAETSSSSSPPPATTRRCWHLASIGGCQFIEMENSTTETQNAAIWMVSVAVEAVTKVLPAVLLSALLVTCLAGLRRSWNVDETRLTTDLTCRLLIERHVTVMAVCIMTSQVLLSLPMSVVWVLDVVYFRRRRLLIVTTTGDDQWSCDAGGAGAQMAAATILTELIFMVNFASKFLLCFLAGRQILTI